MAKGQAALYEKLSLVIIKHLAVEPGIYQHKMPQKW
jgi:hypothetical protein